MTDSGETAANAPSTQQIKAGFIRLLSSRIRAVSDDPQQMREIVYELARVKLLEQFTHADARESRELLQVLEERPPLRQVEAKLGGLDRLPELDGDAVAGLRDDYFAAVGRCIELRPDALLIDKSPLHMNKVPLIHRLFPNARFILALRHPCDAVLSCFMTAFRLNDAMASFLDLETAAEFYDLSFSHWQNCTSLMPVAVEAVRYEDVVDDSEAELRRLLAYLGLEWQPSVIDHVQTARARGLITTASYAQVTERLYRRASGRWERYRSRLDPVLPVLAPWAEKFGYAV